MSCILIAEDDPHILRLISLWLTRQGHEVHEARNGLLAHDFISQTMVDVLVSDINMPGMDGLELIDYVLKEGRVRAGVVVLTNRWDHGDIRDNLSQRGVHVLPKPFSPSKLSELIESLASVSQVPAVAAEPDVDIRGSS